MKFIVALALIVLSFNSYADASETGKVARILPEGNSIISIWLDGTDDNSACQGNGRWIINTTDPLYKEKYSLVLAAAAQGKSITLRHVSSSACSAMNANTVYYVSVNF